MSKLETTGTPASKSPRKSNGGGPAQPRSAKGRPAKAPPPTEPITLRWDLAELPSSQHKAGLAGLALCVEFLQRDSERQGVCECELDASGLSLRVDRAGMQALFDDVYAADREEQERPKKLKDVEPKEVRVRDVVDDKGKPKQETFYVYEPIVPRGRLIGEWDQGTDGKQLWLKLWQDVVWSILRGIPAQRGPYEARGQRQPTDDGGEEWDALAGTPNTRVDLPSTYYLGAQAQSAENVAFRDITRLRFLLHFWPFAVSIYVPATLDREGERSFEAFALAMPDVTDLDAFVYSWQQLARERNPVASGYRPKDAVIDVAAEAGLDVSRRMFDLLERQAGTARTRPYLAAVDVFHVEKDGNNVRMRAVARVDPYRPRIDAYGRVRGAYWSPLFRRQRILNILDEAHPTWERGFGRLCSINPVELTIANNQFRHDCRIAFTEVEMTHAATSDTRSLEELVYQVAQAYVFGHLKSKYELEWNEVKSKGEVEKGAYGQKKDKLAREAFLGVRSRTGADFVAYFTGTLCSVHQHVGQEGYLRLAQAMNDPSEVERLRSLTLLALAAV